MNGATARRRVEEVEVVDLTGAESSEQDEADATAAAHHSYSYTSPSTTATPVQPQWQPPYQPQYQFQPQTLPAPRFPVPSMPAHNRRSPFIDGTYPPDSLPSSIPTAPSSSSSSSFSSAHVHAHTASHRITYSRAHSRSRAPAQTMYAVPALKLADMATKAASYVTSWVTASSSSAAASPVAAPVPSFRPAMARTAAAALSRPSPIPGSAFHSPKLVLAPEGYFPDWGETTMAAFRAVKAYHKRQLRNSRPTRNDSQHANAANIAAATSNSTAPTNSSSSSPPSASSASVFSLPAALDDEFSGVSEEESDDDASIGSQSDESSFSLSPDDTHHQRRIQHDERRIDDSEVDRAEDGVEEEEVLYVSSESDGAYRPSRRRTRSRRSASLSRSPSPSLSPSPLPSSSPPPHPLSSYRRCMTCMHRLSKLHFTREQWALAKEYSQCKECETAAEGRRRRRRTERKRRDKRDRGDRQQRGETIEEHDEDGDGSDGGQTSNRALTRRVWLARKLQRVYKDGQEGEVIEEVDRDEIMIDDDDDVQEQQLRMAQRRKHRVLFSSQQEQKDGEQQRVELDKHADKSKLKLPRGQQTASHLRRARTAGDASDDGAQTEVEDVSQRRRRRYRLGKHDEADGAATEGRKRRRRGDNDEKKKKKRKYNLAPEINPYNRNFTVQQQITNSRSGRLGASADNNTPPPPPLQPDLLAFLRSAFGLDGVDHKSSTQVSSVFAKHMEQRGTLGNGKVFVAVSSVNTLDGSVDSDEEGAANIRRTRQREKQEIAQKGKKAVDQWQPMLGLFAGRDIEKDEVVTTYGGVLVDGDDARRRHASTYTHIRRIRDSRMVRDGRLFSALFDRSQVDMYDQFTIEAKRKSRKRLLPACGAEHVVTALSMEGHEDEMRVGLILLDALQGEKGALYGQRMEAKDQQQLLARIMAHIGEQSTVISGEALKQIDGKRYLSRVRGPALIINEPSATFYSSSPNPYASRSGDTSTEGEQVFRNKSLDISHLFPFSVRPLLLPPLLLHPLPEQRHKALRELTQNVSDSARQLLAATCGKVHELLHTTGMGYMANTGSKRECNVRVMELNPRRDGLAPNEIFYVSCRRIAKGEEILAPYNNNESKSKRMARMKGRQKADEEEDDGDGQDGGEHNEEEGKEEKRALEKQKGEGGDETGRYAGLTGTQKARMKRREAIERKQKKRELLRLRALQRSARVKARATAEEEDADEAEEEEAEEEDDEPSESKAAPSDDKRPRSSRAATSAASREADGADDCDLPAIDVMDLLTPASSSPSPSPSCSVSPSPTSTSPVLSFSPVPPPSPSPAVANKPASNGRAAFDGIAISSDSKTSRGRNRERLGREKEEEEAKAEQARANERRREREQDSRGRERERASAVRSASDKRRAAAIEVIDLEAEGNDEDVAESGERNADSDDLSTHRRGYSILKRLDSPWMPPVIFEQRTRLRSAFGGEVQQQKSTDVGVVVSFQQMNKQQRAHEFERMQRWKEKR